MRMKLRKATSFAFKFLFKISILMFFCEYVIYYFVMYQCSWPNRASEPSEINPEDEVLKAMFLADTHLLGPIKGHWFDKLRREWQMYRSFQTSIQIFQPEVVFFLGDVFDEGHWVTSEYFEEYVARFKSLFSVPAGIRSYVVVGNHDTGFHYRITPELKARFEKAFNSPPVKRVRLKHVNFILINSMAMEGDSCFLCQPAMKTLYRLAGELKCDKNPASDVCDKGSGSKIKDYSKPIILQHFPMYRESDQSCTGDDSDKGTHSRFRPKMDCLSRDSSQMLLRSLEPRLILSGHTHHGCLYHHESRDEESTVSVPEHSVPSYSWRNRDNPSFFLGTFTKDTFQLEKCYMPRETTVTKIYIFASIIILCNCLGFINIPGLGTIYRLIPLRIRRHLFHYTG